jgi:hypothetical protein
VLAPPSPVPPLLDPELLPLLDPELLPLLDPLLDPELLPLLVQPETPRLRRGGIRSLTVPGVV